MFAVDTNLLVYAVDDLSPHHAHCRKMLERWRTERQPWYLTWGIIYEFLRVSTHPKVFRSPLAIKQAWEFIEILLEPPGCGLLLAGADHANFVAECIPRVKLLQGNLVHDFHTAVLLREHGIKEIYTNDMDFHRFPWVQVVNPLN